MGLTAQCFFMEPSLINARALIKRYPILHKESEADFLSSIDVLIVCSAFKNSDELITKAMKRGKHVLLASPFMASYQVLKQLKTLAQEAGTVVQNAWSEKYNSAFLTSLPHVSNVVFIDVARLSQYSPSHAKISVVNDLLFKDIEWVLSTVRSNIRKISANALSVVSNEPDFINAKLEFDNGCIANLTASRVSELNLRKARIYNDKSVVFIDFLARQLKRSYKKGSFLEFEEIAVDQRQEAVNQLDDFFTCIRTGKEPQSTLHDILETRDAAMAVLEKIKAKTNLFVA
jgi:predicted dehydrogenase